MSLLTKDEIRDAVFDELKRAEESVQIISAYCKLHAIKQLTEMVNKSVKKKSLMLRFLRKDIASGSTDMEVLQYCLDRGWDVYIRFDLHAKTYVVDNKRGVVGSANATGRGLNIGRNGNYEFAALIELKNSDLKKIQSLYDDAVKVDRSLIERLESELDTTKGTSAETGWSESIMRLFRNSVETLFAHELPEADTYSLGQYVPFLEMNYSKDEMFRESFQQSNAYQWLLKELKKNEGSLYFGELTARLHDAIIEDPKPYRKDVKVLLHNLLAMIQTTDADEIIIDRPDYSQRIRLAKENTITNEI